MGDTLSSPALPPARRRLLREMAALMPISRNDDCVLVAVDGVDGAGKTTFAAELAEMLRLTGRPVVQVSVDDFHHLRAIRYRRGRESPEGCWLDSFDYDRLAAYVLDPLGPGGDRRYRPIGHDLTTDELLCPRLQTAPAGAVVVVDGLFLHRDELVDRWDLSIWLEVPFTVTAARMSVRDGSDPDPAHPTMARYVQAQRTYMAKCQPARRADVVVDNAEPARPMVVPAGLGGVDRSGNPA